MQAPSDRTLTINKGICYAVFAYDIGWTIDLEAVNRRICSAPTEARMSGPRSRPISIQSTVEVMVYDFGAVTAFIRRSSVPKIAKEVEGYIIFSIESYSPAQSFPPWASLKTALAQVLCGERMPLADQEIQDAMACHISCGLAESHQAWHPGVTAT